MLLNLLKQLIRGSNGPAGSRSQPEDAKMDDALEHYRQRRFAETIALCRRRVAGDAADAEAWNLLAAALLADHQADMACDCFERALALAPDRADWCSNYGEALRRAGDPSLGLELCRRALQLNPRHPEAWHNCALCLQDLWRNDEALDAFGSALAARPDFFRAHSGMLYLLCRQTADAEAVAAEHFRWGRRHADALTAASLPQRADPDPERRLRVGYVSGDFCLHPVSHFIDPVLACHDRERFAVHCYFTGDLPDEVTRRLRQYGGIWCEAAGLADEALAACVRADRIDILVDLSGHTAHNRLLVFARRPAPLQLTWLGYMNTTGMRAMDYRLTDAVADPPGAGERYHSEALLRLPLSQWCYAPPAGVPEVNPLPAIASGAVTFASFNHLSKITGHVIGLWARILRQAPRSRLVVLGAAAKDSGVRIRARFEQQGIDAGRVELLPRLPLEGYWRAYQGVDIALDTFPYNGATTTCDSLWMGVPVISRAGTLGGQRSGASLLASVGLSQLVTDSDEDYVAAASRLARDLPALAALRLRLREEMRRSPLLDAARFTRDLETAYRTIWRDWCAGQTHGAHGDRPDPG